MPESIVCTCSRCGKSYQVPREAVPPVRGVQGGRFPPPSPQLCPDCEAALGRLADDHKPGTLPAVLGGKAWYVTYPRRPDQDYVCADTAYVAAALASDLVNLPGWKWCVRLVAFQGAGALSAETSLLDLLDALPEEAQGQVMASWGVLWHNGRSRSERGPGHA